MANKTGGPKPPTKSEIMNNIAEATGLTKKEIAAVFEALTGEIEKTLPRKAVLASLRFQVYAKSLLKIDLHCLNVRFETQVRAKWSGPNRDLPAGRLKYDLSRALKTWLSRARHTINQKDRWHFAGGFFLPGFFARNWS